MTDTLDPDEDEPIDENSKPIPFDDLTIPPPAPIEKTWLSAPLLPKPALESSAGEIFIVGPGGSLEKIGDVTGFVVDPLAIAATVKAMLAGPPAAASKPVFESFFAAFVEQSRARPIVCPDPRELARGMTDHFGETSAFLPNFAFLDT